MLEENVGEWLSAGVVVLVLDEGATGSAEADVLTPTQQLTEKR